MPQSVFGAISDEIKEVVKDTAREVVNIPKETGKQFFTQMLDISKEANLTPEQLAKKKSEDERKKQEALALHRKKLMEEMQNARQPQKTKYEQAKEQEIYEKQRQVELQKQQQRSQLPQMSQKAKPGGLFARKKKPMNTMEMAKKPTQ